MGAVSQWLDGKTGDQGVLGSNPAYGTSLRYFRSSYYPLSQCLLEGTLNKICWSLLSGVYARGSKISHTGVNV